MTFRTLRILLLGTIGAAAWQVATVSHAADLLSSVPLEEQDVMLPAVSAINGKWELSAGYISPTGINGRFGGSLSAPLGERLGLQGDIMFDLNPGGLTTSAAGHFFTRDPSSYLAGVAAGVVVAPGATLVAIGGEGELYLDRVSLEGWAGFASINYVNPAILDRAGVFAIGDLAYYPLDDLRLALGGTYMLGDFAVRASTEYQLSGLGMPLSLTSDARLHADGTYSVMFGLKGYLGGDDSKPLIDRHRQDDPPNRALDLFGAGASLLYAAAPSVPGDPEEICLAREPEDQDHEWVWNSGISDCESIWINA